MGQEAQRLRPGSVLALVAVVGHRARGRPLCLVEWEGWAEEDDQGLNLLWLKTESLALKHIGYLSSTEVAEI